MKDRYYSRVKQILINGNPDNSYLILTRSSTTCSSCLVVGQIRIGFELRPKLSKLRLLPHLTATALLAKHSCWIGRFLERSGEDNPNHVETKYSEQNVKSRWQAKLKKVKGGQQLAAEGLNLNLLPNLNLSGNLSLNQFGNPPFFDSCWQGFYRH